MTIREIAQKCGVSRGTVDRVLNGRGKVRPETEALILDAIREAGYTKNIAGRALNVRKSAPVIGVVLSSEGNPFFDEVIDGMRAAEQELRDYAVTTPIHTMRGYDTDEQLALIDAIAPSISALVLHPINDARVAERVDRLARHGVPTVTVNSDLEASRRSCYVGSDYARGGRIAAGIVRLATAGVARLGILTGVESVLGHVQRLRGFEERLQEACPGIAIAARESAGDDIERAYHVTRAMLQRDPDIDALMMIAAGLEGVCRAVIEQSREETMRVFAFDNIPTTEAMMRRGLVRAVIGQQPYQQGYQAIRAAYDIILRGVVDAERRLMENQIMITETIEQNCTINKD